MSSTFVLLAVALAVSLAIVLIVLAIRVCLGVWSAHARARSIEAQQDHRVMTATYEQHTARRSGSHGARNRRVIRLKTPS